MDAKKSNLTPAHLASVQPGGGLSMRLELAWGNLRRWWLRTFRPGYVTRMAALRQGQCPACPHDIVDPRDLKYFHNVCGFSFPPESDPFAWRSRLGVARLGWAEILVFGGLSTILTLATLRWFPYIAPLPAALAVFVVGFFRDPERRIIQSSGVIVAPADGKIDDIEEIDTCEPLGGPAVKIGIFLSLFDVHINRTPERSRVIDIKFIPGHFRNTMHPNLVANNQQLCMLLESEHPPHRRLLVKQIAGTIARRIVCEARPGQLLACGEKYGMIKFGSRTELYLPKEPNLHIEATLHQKVYGGISVLARQK